MEANNKPPVKKGIRKSDTLRQTYVFARKQVYIVVLVIAILFAVLWIAKSLQISAIRKDHSEREQAIKDQAKRMLVQSDQHYLKLLAKPYVWAVRTEMMKGNINQINLYANDMVKQRNFQSIVVINDQGIIVSSTDKKLEGKDITAAGPQVNVTTDSTVVAQTNDSLLVMSSPIMGFNNRLGTLVVRYSPKHPVFHETE